MNDLKSTSQINFSLLRRFFTDFNFDFDSQISFTKVHDQLNLARAGELILYHLHDTEHADGLLYKRMADLKIFPALLILSSKPKFKLTENLNYAVVRNGEWASFQEKLFDQIFPFPKDKKMVGITGTNGKTSTTYFLHHLLKQQNKKSMLMGTLGLWIHGVERENFSLTSPSYYLFRKFIYHYQEEFDYCVFEMSSHALDQNRFYQVSLDAAGWTSFTQDHLDYHITMEQYFAAKKSITKYLKPNAYLFLPASQKEIQEKLKHPQVKMAEVISEDRDLNPLTAIHFMRDNLSVAISILSALLNIPSYQLKFDLSKIPQVPGRMIIKKINKSLAVIDYAHTPDALENACQSLKSNFPDHRLKVLFGCGGNRDRSKRAIMGQSVSKYADFIYVTSDNPRFENPENIIDDIIPGLSRPYLRHADRKKLLQEALQELSSQEILLIAGKGHESYIQINEVKHPYSDEAVVDSFLKREG